MNSYPKFAFHSSETPLTKDNIKVPLHVGTKDQAFMRRPFGYLYKLTLIPGARTTRMVDHGSWAKNRLQAAMRRADLAVTLNRFEGVSVDDLDAAIRHSSAPDAIFRKNVPSASDSWIIFNADLIENIDLV